MATFTVVENCSLLWQATSSFDVEIICLAMGGIEVSASHDQVMPACLVRTKFIPLLHNILSHLALHPAWTGGRHTGVLWRWLVMM
jgi:hypothetical protein